MLKEFGETYTQDEIEANRELWLTALESGEYTQTTGVLRNEEGFCCLGVACEVLGLSSSAVEGRFYYGAETSHLPRTVMTALGMLDSYGRYQSAAQGTRQLTELNDTDRLSFVEIAKVIRSKPPGLFIEQNQPVASV